MIQDELKAILLPSSLIIKNFVIGEEDCCYEKYLLEFLNISDYFQKKSLGNKYVFPEKENNGECDCNSEFYSLDFKLFTSKTMLQASSILKPQIISKFNGGVVIHSSPKNRKGFINATRIHVVLRDYSFEQLCKLEKNEIKKQGIENDICEILNTLKTKKNLLLFYPYEFKVESVFDFEYVVKYILYSMQESFASAMQYRQYFAASFDTYMCFVYKNKMIFCEVKKSDFHYIESIDLKKSNIYKKLSEYSVWY